MIRYKNQRHLSSSEIDRTIDMLAEGFGVEDIAIALSAPVYSVRLFVSGLRGQGLLVEIFSCGAAA